MESLTQSVPKGLAGSVDLSDIRPQLLAPTILLLEPRSDEGISHVQHFHQHVMHELILFIHFRKKSPTNV